MRLDLSSPQREALARRAVARARTQGLALAAEPPVPPFSLLVDLSSEPIGPRWWRGVATLGLLCAAALAMEPGLGPVADDQVPVATGVHFQMNPMLSAPDEEATPPARPADPGQPAKPTIVRSGDEIRIQGEVTEGLYWSLRDAGVPADISADYLHALSTQIDVGDDVSPFDRFDLVIGNGTAGTPASLLYAAVHRTSGGDVALIKWTEAGRTDWFSSGEGESRSLGLMAPVNGHITSGFGMRYHPILHYARMHDGIDFGAPIGTPIVAAADGQVIAAGWSGGYGREVKLAHAGGLTSLYGHMSDIVAQPGQMVRQGQVIGYVGSSGLSTGPHVHFEVRVNGTAVDPMQVQMQRREQIAGPERQAFNARLKQLLAIGTKPA